MRWWQSRSSYVAEPASSKAVLRFESRPDFSLSYTARRNGDGLGTIVHFFLLRQQNTKTPNNKNNKNIVNVQPLNEHIYIPENNAKLDHIKFGI
jgi:hypothetical protein